MKATRTAQNVAHARQAAEAVRDYTQDEIYAAAASLGLLRYLPDRQMQLSTTAPVERTAGQQGVKDV